ncbi:MAG TPA: type VI secretion system protein TssA [Polyangia bacterium]
MPVKNIESLLQPISADAPCGPDLEYDAAFLELDRLSQGKPEQQMGNTIVPAEEPDWKEVATRALELVTKTKDLRIAVRLTRALLYTEGFAGLADGIALVRGIIETFWDGFYPKLDPEDGNDPTFRVNIVMGLCDAATIIDRIRVSPIVAARSFGRFSLRDFAVVSGEIPPTEGVEPPTASAIEGAFSESAVADLQATTNAMRSALDSLAAIESFIGEKVGAENGTNFSKLTEVLASAAKILAPRLAARGVGSDASGNAGDGVGDGGGAAQGGGKSISGEINCREDVIRVLDKICLYYERVEPSSPIPILLQRSKRLVSANFLDIIRDLAPDGLTQVEHLRGKDGT